MTRFPRFPSTTVSTGCGRKTAWCRCRRTGCAKSSRRAATISRRTSAPDSSSRTWFEEAIRQSKPVPIFPRTDRYQVGLTLHCTLEDPRFVRFLEKVGQETTAGFSTHDWLILDRIAREQKLQEADKHRLKRLAPRNCKYSATPI